MGNRNLRISLMGGSLALATALLGNSWVKADDALVARPATSRATSAVPVQTVQWRAQSYRWVQQPNGTYAAQPYSPGYQAQPGYYWNHGYYSAPYYSYYGGRQYPHSRTFYPGPYSYGNAPLFGNPYAYGYGVYGH